MWVSYVWAAAFFFLFTGYTYGVSCYTTRPWVRAMFTGFFFILVVAFIDVYILHVTYYRVKLKEFAFQMDECDNKDRHERVYEGCTESREITDRDFMWDLRNHIIDVGTFIYDHVTRGATTAYLQFMLPPVLLMSIWITLTHLTAREKMRSEVEYTRMHQSAEDETRRQQAKAITDMAQIMSTMQIKTSMNPRISELDAEITEVF